MTRLIVSTQCFVLLLLVHGNASAQFFDHITNPKVSVPLTHPPDLGLKVNRIAFGPAKGDKAYYKQAALATDANYGQPR